MIQKQKGITLVALVITIIILLILAGVVISVVVNNDLIGISKEAAEETQIQAIRETIMAEIIVLRLEAIENNAKLDFTPNGSSWNDLNAKLPEGWHITPTASQLSKSKNIKIASTYTIDRGLKLATGDGKEYGLTIGTGVLMAQEMKYYIAINVQTYDVIVSKTEITVGDPADPME